MIQTSFLPDNKPVLASILANLPYGGSDLEKIIEGTNPSQFPVSNYSLVSWGLLYLGETEMGFYVHPTKSPLAALFSNSAQADSPNGIYFHIPYTEVTGVTIKRPQAPTTLFGKMFAWFLKKEAHVCILTWNNNFTMEFSLMTDSTEFEKKLRECPVNQ